MAAPDQKRIDGIALANTMMVGRTPCRETRLHEYIKKSGLCLHEFTKQFGCIPKFERVPSLTTAYAIVKILNDTGNVSVSVIDLFPPDWIEWASSPKEREYLGQRLTRIRKKAKCSIDVLASVIGIPAEEIAWIEAEHIPLSAEIALRIADALDVDVRYLIRGESKKSTEATHD